MVMGGTSEPPCLLGEFHGLFTDRTESHFEYCYRLAQFSSGFS